MKKVVRWSQRRKLPVVSTAAWILNSKDLNGLLQHERKSVSRCENYHVRIKRTFFAIHYVSVQQNVPNCQGMFLCPNYANKNVKIWALKSFYFSLHVGGLKGASTPKSSTSHWPRSNHASKIWLICGRTPNIEGLAAFFKNYPWSLAKQEPCNSLSSAQSMRELCSHLLSTS